MSKELDYLDKLLEFKPLTLCERMIIESIKEKIQRIEAIEKGKNTDIIDNYMAFKNDNAKSSEALECVDVLKEDGCITTLYQGKALETIRQALLKAQEDEKENEILKEIIKSLFDRGCPLHQYIDKDFGLTIEVDNECSIMHLGKFNDIDLDKKLNEILKNLIY